MEKVKEKTAASYDFQDELLKTYFSTSPTTATAYTPAEVPQKNERTHQVLLIITASLIVLFLVLIFLLSKYNIVITPITRQQTTAGDSDDDRILLSKDGEIDRDFIENIIFYEGADKKSGWEKGLVS
ncbi:MAG: hypothetical protein WCG78_08690, partial [Candidatus Omnitrophota bacterium]